MSVYSKEDPFYLKESIVSMLKQTISPDEIVIVKDGVLTEELEDIIVEYSKNKIFNIVALDENVGLGKALSIGLTFCKNEIVVRMDSDDISEPHRCEIQIKEMYEDESISVIGSSVAEFIEERNNIVAFKTVKQDHTEIMRQMKFRNPMNHPTVVFKKSHVFKAGNYRTFLLNEDYFLWIRMIQMGYKFKNVTEPLVKMRITDETYMRRGGWEYFVTQKKLFDYMLKNKFINPWEYVTNNFLRIIIRVLIPNKVRKYIYLAFFRKGGHYD